jgi:WD40 repeat protein
LLAVTARASKNDNVKTFLTLWDPHTGKERIKIDLGLGQFIGGPVLSRDGQRVALSAEPGPVRVFDLATGKTLCTIELSDASLLFSADGTKLFTKSSAATAVQEWDIATGKEARPLLKPREPQDLTILRGGGLGGLALSPDAKTIAAGDVGNAVRFIDVASGKLQETPGAHASALSVVSFTADGKLLTHASDAAAYLWDPLKGRVVKEIRAPAGVVDFLPSPDGRLIAALDNDAEITLHETAGGKVVGKITDARPDQRMVFFSPDSRTLLVHNLSDTKAVLYGAASGKQRCSLPVRAFAPTQVVVTENELLAPVWVFSPDGKILVGYVAKNVLAVWDTNTGKLRQKLALPKGLPVRSGAISPDNGTLALDLADGRVALWELATGQERASFGARQDAKPGAKVTNDFVETLLGGINAISVAFSPDGRLLAQAAAGQPLRLWDVCTGQTLAEFAGHQGIVSALAFAPDGRTLVSGSWDTTGLVWDIQGANNKAGPLLHELDAAAASSCWSDLTAKDAAKAWQAICKLWASPKQAAALVKQQIQPAPALDLAKVQELLARLDSSKYKDRLEATAELFKLGERVLPCLEKVLASNPTLEMRKRVEDLVERLMGLPLAAEQVQALRAVEVLQRANTPQACQVLEHLASGAPGAQVTVSAQAALARNRK